MEYGSTCLLCGKSFFGTTEKTVVPKICYDCLEALLAHEERNNLQLYLAAPEMYGALKALMQAFNKLSGGLPNATFTTPYFLMFNAIKKAEGKEI